MKLKSIILGALILFGKIGAEEPKRLTGMWYMSLPGSWVGGGVAKSYLESDNSHFRIQVFTYNHCVGIRYNEDDYANHWSADFTAPNQEILVPGIYKGAQRDPFNNQGCPGLDIDVNARGNNKLVGDFEVLEIDYDEEGQVRSFAANFVQYGASFDGEKNEPAMFGGIRYNSSIPFEHGWIGPSTDPSILIRQ